MDKEYITTSIFDNTGSQEDESVSAFSLEDLVRSAAQRMIQAALEAEVAEFLHRSRYEKTSATEEEFRGYRCRFAVC